MTTDLPYRGAVERVASARARCFDGAISSDCFEWNERMIRGRAEAVLADGVPDAYLW
jgi:hypothetical protein